MRADTPRFAALVILALATIAGCGRDASESGPAADVPEEQRYGGTAVVGLIGDLQSMNSLVSSDYNSNGVQRELLFMPLVKYDERIEPIPWLAERFDIEEIPGDSLRITFHIRRDVRWHDGQPTTAEDVRFTFERAVDPRTAFPNISNLDLWSREVEVPDPYTIVFKLRPHADYIDIWYQTPIMPRHILGDVPPEQLLSHPFGISRPVGNGPFKHLRRNPGQEWVFEANDDFPEALGGRPYLDRIVIRAIPEMTTLLTELLTGRVDVYVRPNPNQADLINNSPGVRLFRSPGRQWTYLAFNTRRPFFQDARVRRAIAHALDRDGMIDALLYGYGEVGRSTVTPAHWSYDANDPQTILQHDTALARRLLTEAGWTPGPDGILRNAEGRQFRFEMITNAGNDVRRDILEIVQAQLRPLGIVATPRLMEWNTMVALIQGRERNFDATVSAWVDYFKKDDADILHSRNLDGPYQQVGFSHPRADHLIDTLNVMTDRAAAAPLWREYQHLMVQESPYIALYYPENINGVRDRLQGVEMDIRGELITARDWWILPQARGGTAAGAAPAGSAPADTTAGDTTP